MRLPRVKFTVRRMMILIAASALAIWLGISFVDVYSAKKRHAHLGIDLRSAPRFEVISNMEPPFWPRYWRRLLGRPWRSQPLCPPTPGFVDEECQIAHPEIAFMSGRNLMFHGTPRLIARFDQIVVEQAHLGGQGAKK